MLKIGQRKDGNRLDKQRILYDDRKDSQRIDYEKRVLSYTIAVIIFAVIVLGVIPVTFVFFGIPPLSIVTEKDSFADLILTIMLCSFFTSYLVLYSFFTYKFSKLGIQIYENGICLYNYFYPFSDIVCLHWNTKHKYNGFEFQGERSPYSVFNRNDILKPDKFLDIIKEKIEVSYDPKTYWALQTALHKTPNRTKCN